MSSTLSADASFKAREAEEADALINCLVLSTNDWLPLREDSSSLTADLTADLTCSSRLPAPLAILKPRVKQVCSQDALR